MNHDAFAVLADAYLDGSLDEEQAERLLAYLRDSPVARRRCDRSRSA